MIWVKAPEIQPDEGFGIGVGVGVGVGIGVGIGVGVGVGAGVDVAVATVVGVAVDCEPVQPASVATIRKPARPMAGAGENRLPDERVMLVPLCCYGPNRVAKRHLSSAPTASPIPGPAEPV